MHAAWRYTRRLTPLIVLYTLSTLPLALTAQRAPGSEKSSNIKLVYHVPLAGATPLAGTMECGVVCLGRRTSDIEIEQEMSRPYAYVTHRMAPTGFHIIDLRDPLKAKVLWHWQIEDADLHRGAGALNPMYVKVNGKYYLTIAFQFTQGGPDIDLGAIVFDVTGLPDVTKIREVGRIRATDTPGGFHESFAYKHSNGEALLVVTTTGTHANVYDIAKFVAGDPNQGLVGQIPLPQGANGGAVQLRGYHDFFIGYDAATHQDRFYGAGAGGYYVYDITNLKDPKLLTSITGISGVQFGHTFTPTPDGHYAVTEVEYRTAPLRIFDLKPGLDGQVANISRPIGAWTANAKNFSHNHQMRWPYVFVAAFDDGMQVFNMMDPTNPVTVGYYDTWDGPDGTLAVPETTFNGGWGIDVRNADGLIVMSDFTTGFWGFKMEGFDGWNGHDWGMPNVSNAQDWDNGPEGAPKQSKPVT
jgi:hypothetical protein